jgi:hypothetical protein
MAGLPVSPGAALPIDLEQNHAETETRRRNEGSRSPKKRVAKEEEELRVVILFTADVASPWRYPIFVFSSAS